eukprot:gnl/TRDRNA2_/TRDRNA2_44342_c0_seq2.p1 gnl/TRDRNA2_/TRDRNA2_44342_c0~~gnl/TRDRNA2_/TRDRNA2_44342_c0_seq2.p1  ORF type:complete len:174 (+),score=12.78 gnl/TRDRNA2_/TRDRNA2_44342_c0_seq2:137-658(+)
MVSFEEVTNDLDKDVRIWYEDRYGGGRAIGGWGDQVLEPGETSRKKKFPLAHPFRVCVKFWHARREGERRLICLDDYALPFDHKVKIRKASRILMKGELVDEENKVPKIPTYPWQRSIFGGRLRNNPCIALHEQCMRGLLVVWLCAVVLLSLKLRCFPKLGGHRCPEPLMEAW